MSTLATASAVASTVVVKPNFDTKKRKAVEYETTVPIKAKRSKLQLDSTGAIFFKSNQFNGYACLSNFWPFVKPGASKAVFDLHGPQTDASFSFVIDGLAYSSVEHWYQAEKYRKGHPAIAEQLRTAPTALDAKKTNTICKKRFSMDADFPTRQMEIMEQGLMAKFSQNLYLKQVLLSTGVRTLHETRGRSRDLWCYQPDGTADNLGRLLMRVREQLRASDPVAAAAASSQTV